MMTENAGPEESALSSWENLVWSYDKTPLRDREMQRIGIESDTNLMMYGMHSTRIYSSSCVRLLF